MKSFRADLHIHSVLSPCGDLDMSPANIIRIALEKQLDIIGITDHNSTRQAKIIREYGKKNGIYVLTGAEVTTMEEVHCLTFFPTEDALDLFQNYLDKHLPTIKNNPDKFGYQVVVNEYDEIIYQENRLLISALSQSIEDVADMVKKLGGIFIPAHIDKKRDSIFSQLGFIPTDLQYDALELSKHTSVQTLISTIPILKNASFIQSSDAHYPEEIGSVFTQLEMNNICFEEIISALHRLGNKSEK